MKPRWELGALLTVACFSVATGFTTYYSSDCSSSFISDGWCDSSNNNFDCDYDGGDCCSCDCLDDTFECGIVGFTCIDPTSSCYYHHYYDDDYFDDDDDNYLDDDDGSTSCTTSFISDGMCDSSNNISGCDFDGGDCCSCDCLDDTYECGIVGFTCIDPTSSCYYHHYYDDDYFDDDDDNYLDDDDGITEPTPEPTPEPSPEPNPEPTPMPAAEPIPEPIPEPTPEPTVPTGCISAGDGLCDQANNNAECNWDGGDCCECDCSEPSIGEGLCGSNGYDCINPDSSCTSNEGDDEAPVGAIVGGAVGGTVFLAGAAVLACLLATGRLKCGKGRSSSTSPAVPAAPSGAPAAVTGSRASAASSSATAPAPCAPAGAPPAASGGLALDPMLTVREVPVARATPPPPYGESNPPYKE